MINHSAPLSCANSNYINTFLLNSNTTTSNNMCTTKDIDKSLSKINSSNILNLK